ncbi:MAG: putative DNA modification/repair radical SAM protein [Lentisphaeria bacterium]|nr:putative DNA modification/repair radical SAM protein [Lentisphaeria bacterium]
MDLEAKTAILADSAKYDASCASSGVSVQRPGTTGACQRSGVCHSWTADGRCVSLLKILLTNRCVYDCAFCVNRRSNDRPRASLDVGEVVDLTMEFYRRNCIEGLFLSTGIERSPDDTMERLCAVAEQLRERRGFRGYIHLKAIPGADAALVRRAGRHADRMSVNIELPSGESLRKLSPQKTRAGILGPMGALGEGIAEYHAERRHGSRVPPFVPAGQSTQMVVGASPETDYQILRLSESLYRHYALKRVYYSAYVPVNDDNRLPALREPPLLREHRLYQADWLLRNYGFGYAELLSPEAPSLDLRLDPKCSWALRHPERFPVDVNTAPYEVLLRVPGIGVRSARTIRAARRFGRLRLEDLRRLGVVLKRAQFFLTVDGYCPAGGTITPERLRQCLIAGRGVVPAWWQPELRIV